MSDVIHTERQLIDAREVAAYDVLLALERLVTTIRTLWVERDRANAALAVKDGRIDVLTRAAERFRRAVNRHCSCGGRGPDDNPCVACSIWHDANATNEQTAAMGAAETGG